MAVCQHWEHWNTTPGHRRFTIYKSFIFIFIDKHFFIFIYILIVY